MTTEEIDRLIEGVDADMADHRAELNRLSREYAALYQAKLKIEAGSTPRLRVAGGVG
jgi:hypothetical protein